MPANVILIDTPSLKVISSNHNVKGAVTTLYSIHRHGKLTHSRITAENAMIEIACYLFIEEGK